MISTLKEVREALEMLHTGLAWFKDSYPQDVNGSDDEAETEFQAALTKLDALIAVHEKAEPVTDDRVDQIAHNVEPGDWNLLAYRDCWHKGFNVGFREAEKELEKMCVSIFIVKHEKEPRY